MRKFFKYIEPLWTGTDGKISLRAVLAIAFSVDFIRNLSHAIYKWDASRSMDGLSLSLGIEAGLIAAILGLTTYQNTQTSLTKTTEVTASDPQTLKQTTEAKGGQSVEQIKE